MCSAQYSGSVSSVILAHAALKWSHTFVPRGLYPNPLDSEFRRNIIDYAKQHNSYLVTKKKPIIKDIIRQYPGCS